MPSEKLGFSVGKAPTEKPAAKQPATIQLPISLLEQDRVL
jgi:hypothetical protein